MLDSLKAALVGLTDQVYRYTAPPNSAPPYIVWAEDSENPFFADEQHAETAIQGTIDLYTRDEDDPLRLSIPSALNNLTCAWYLNSVQYEEETDLIHVEWVFEVM